MQAPHVSPFFAPLLDMEVPDASEPTAEGEEVILRNAKIITLVIVGVLSLIASVVPWIISHRRLRNSEYLFSVLNCLSGGVVLGAALSHLYADADGDLREYFGEDDYPYTALFCGASLMFLYVLERLLMSGKHSHSEIVFDESTVRIRR
jgi:TRAP-type C4-dicarboxylate transport system permease small subunit